MNKLLPLFWLLLRLTASVIMIQAGLFALNEVYDSAFRCLVFSLALQQLPDIMGVLTMIYYNLFGYPSDNEHLNP